MDKYKTVKEVCALTGLTRKHLYYFHHEKVVEAAAFANYSVEGNVGYKLYDDAAVEKRKKFKFCICGGNGNCQNCRKQKCVENFHG